MRTAILAVCFLSACASVPLTQKIVEQKVENREVADIVKRSALPEQEKKRVLQAIEKTEQLAEKSDIENTELREDVEGLKKYRAIVIGGIVVLALAGIAFWKFKS